MKKKEDTMKKKVAALLTVAGLSLGGIALTSPAAHACVGVRCTVDCIRRIVSGNPACPD